MSKHITLQATPRESGSKGKARAARRNGFVPAVIYGDNKSPVTISLNPIELIKTLQKGQLFTHVCDLNVDKEKHTVLARDVQYHPVTDQPMHVDFLRVTDKTRITADVPVSVINEKEAPGLQTGGILNLVRRRVEVSCRANNIPENIEADITGLEMNDSLKMSDITLPEGVQPTITDRDFTILTIAAPAKIVEEVEEPVEEGFQEAEVIGESSDDAAEGDAEAAAEE